MIRKDPTIIHVPLDDDKERKIIDEIQSELSVIDKKRGEIDFLEKTQENWDRYHAIADPYKPGPWPESAKYFIALTMMHCDIVAIKAQRQSLGANPMMTLESEDENVEGVRDWEDWLDYILREDIKIEKLLASGVYREATVQGTSFVRVPHVYEVENQTYIRVYQPEELETYKLDSWKFKHTDKQRQENIDKLGSFDENENFIPGEEIHVRVDEEVEVQFGPRPYRVPIEKLYLRPDIHDLSRHKLIDEVRDYTWLDIQHKVDIDFFYPDAVEKIKNIKADDYSKSDYVIHECILYTNLDEKDRFQRYVITLEPETETILRAIYYPYKHNHIYYVPYYIKPRDESVYGYSMAELLKDPNMMVNGLWNSAMDRNALGNQPPLEIADSSLDLTAYSFKPNEWIPTKSPGSIRVLETQKFGTDNIALMNLAQIFTEMATGVSAGQMSGQVNPIDPRSPMGKTAMLLQESNFRIESFIIALQKGNEELSFQVEKLMIQYKPDEVKIPKELLESKVRRIAHGTTMAINKGQELQGIERFIFIATQIAPDLIQNPELRNILLISFLDNLGGTLEKQKSKLLPQVPEGQGAPQQGMEEQIKKVLEQMPEGEREALMADIERIKG